MGEDTFNRLRPYGYVLIGLIFLAMIARSFEDFGDMDVIVDVVGVVIVVVVWFGYLHLSRVADWLSTRQEGMALLLVGTISFSVIAVLSPENAAVLDRELFIAFAGVVVFALVYLVGGSLPIQSTRPVGAVGFLLGVGLLGFAAVTFQSNSLWIAADSAIFGLILGSVGLAMLLRADEI